jgi:hypothetical protein
MCFGGIGAAICYIGLLPIGIVMGAVAGWRDAQVFLLSL